MGMATQRCSAGGGGTFGVWQRPKSKVPCAPSAQSQPDAGPLRTFVFYWTKISFFQHPRFLKKDFVVLFFHRKISLSRSNRIQSLTKDQHTPNRWLTNGFSFFFLCVWQRKRPPRPPNILFSVSTTSRVPSAAIACVCVCPCAGACVILSAVSFFKQKKRRRAPLPYRRHPPQLLSNGSSAKPLFLDTTFEWHTKEPDTSWTVKKSSAGPAIFSRSHIFFFFPFSQLETRKCCWTTMGRATRRPSSHREATSSSGARNRRARGARTTAAAGRRRARAEEEPEVVLRLSAILGRLQANCPSNTTCCPSRPSRRTSTSIQRRSSTATEGILRPFHDPDCARGACRTWTPQLWPAHDPGITARPIGTRTGRWPKVSITSASTSTRRSELPLRCLSINNRLKWRPFCRQRTGPNTEIRTDPRPIRLPSATAEWSAAPRLWRGRLASSIQGWICTRRSIRTNPTTTNSSRATRCSRKRPIPTATGSSLSSRLIRRSLWSGTDPDVGQQQIHAPPPLVVVVVSPLRLLLLDRLAKRRRKFMRAGNPQLLVLHHCPSARDRMLSKRSGPSFRRLQPPNPSSSTTVKSTPNQRYVFSPP